TIAKIGKLGRALCTGSLHWHTSRPIRQLPALSAIGGNREAQSETDTSSREARRAEDFVQALGGMAREVLGAAVGLPQWRRLEWAAALQLGAVPVGELPPWQLEQQSLSGRDVGVDLVSLDGKLVVQCKRRQHGTVATALVQHFVATAVEVYNASRLVLVLSGTASLTADGARLLKEAGGEVLVLSDCEIDQLIAGRSDPDEVNDENTVNGDAVARPLLRQCQIDCLKACAQGARVIEMACGSGKTQVMRELADKCLGEGQGPVLVLVPSRVLLMQLGQLFPEFCLVGTGHNDRIDWTAPGYVAVYDSAHLLSNLSFAELYVDEAHHPLPKGCPEAAAMYLFSATHSEQVDFRYALDRAIEDGVLSDYDITVPIVGLLTHLADLAMILRRGAGRYRRVLAYCNTVQEAKRFQEEAKKAGLVAWHINGDSPDRARQRVLQEFSGPLQGPLHVLVTVQVLGEGVNIGNADTCIFVEPRRSYVAILQAMGRVLRRHPDKPLAHVILPAVPETYLQGGGGGSPVAVPVAGLGSKTRSSSSSSSASIAGKSGRQLPNIETIFGQETVETTLGRSQDVTSAVGIPRRQRSTTPEAITGPQAVSTVSSVIPCSVAPASGARSTGSTTSSQIVDDSSTVQIASSISKKAGHVGKNGSSKAGASSSPGRDNAEHGTWPGITLHSAPALAVKESVSQNASELDEVTGGAFSKLAFSSIEGADPELLSEQTRRSSVPEQAEAEVGHYALSLGTTQEEVIPLVTITTTPPVVRSRLQRVGRQGRSLKLTSAGIPALGELGRFLQVLAAADSRLADSLLQDTPGGRIRFVDARGAKPGAVQLASTPEVISKVWNQLSSMARVFFVWKFRFKQMDEFCKTYGRIPRYDTKDEPERTIGVWLHNQRNGMKSGQLEAERRLALLNAHPIVAQRARRWADQSDYWTSKLQELEAFTECNGRLPRQEENAIGSWIWHQGSRFKAGQFSTDQVQGLERIDHAKLLVDCCRLNVTYPWMKAFDELRVHLQAAARLPSKSLRWISLQRRNYRNGHLDQHQVISFSVDCVSGCGTKGVVISKESLILTNFLRWRICTLWFVSSYANLRVGACQPPATPSLDAPRPSEGNLTFRVNQTMGPKFTAEAFAAHRHSFIGEAGRPRRHCIVGHQGCSGTPGVGCLRRRAGPPGQGDMWLAQSEERDRHCAGPPPWAEAMLLLE
ncbi:unnamed protein product, partial [Polarella glacialis]